MFTQKMILHVGMPKTGSSALQSWANVNRKVLLQNGIDYPETSSNFIQPKHQELIADLSQTKTKSLESFINRNISPTLFLSTEGLTNHLYDFRPLALRNFRRVTAHMQLHVFMVYRKSQDWLKAQYKQALVNPSISKYGYGTSKTFSEYVKLPRNILLTATKHVIEDVKAAYGAYQVTAVEFEQDWFLDFLALLNLNPNNFSLPSHINQSISDDEAELIRQLNGLLLDEAKRKMTLSFFQKNWQTRNEILKSYESNTIVNYSLDSWLLKITEKLVPQNNEQRRLIRILLEQF